MSNEAANGNEGLAQELESYADSLPDLAFDKEGTLLASPARSNLAEHVPAERPNLFTYATSELSQDAALCWLLAWADPRVRHLDPELAAAGTALLSRLMESHGQFLPEPLDTVDVERQVDHIDILVVLNGKLAVLIEDKVGSQDGTQKLVGYVDRLTGKGNTGKPRRFDDDAVFPVYIQTGDQSDYRHVEAAKYVPFLRGDLLDVLRPHATANGANDILADFYRYMERVEAEVISFREKPLGKWTGRAWQGFFSELQKQLGYGSWGCVPSPAGGFFAFWWRAVQAGSTKLYLQLERHYLCIKMSVDEGPVRPAWDRWHAHLVSVAKTADIELARPKRFQQGKTMTAGIREATTGKKGTEGSTFCELWSCCGEWNVSSTALLPALRSSEGALSGTRLGAGPFEEGAPRVGWRASALSSTMQSVSTAFDLPSLLDREVNTLLLLEQRQSTLEAVFDDLQDKTLGKRFIVRNQAAWMLALDGREHLMLLMASWAKGACASKGLLPVLEDNFSTKLRRLSQAPTPDSDLARIQQQGRAEAFARLFPDATRDRASPSDIQGLKKHFVERAKPIVDDRNNNVAHRYEYRKTGEATVLELGESREFLTFAQRMVNDLEHVGLDKRTPFVDLSGANSSTGPGELVDSVLLWEPDRKARLPEPERKALYETLHANQKPTELFNA